MAEVRRLHRSPGQAMLGGVCAGLADYFSLDPTIVRLVVVILALVAPPAILIAYVLAWALVPADDAAEVPAEFARREQAKDRVVASAQEGLQRAREGASPQVIVGVLLLAVGCLLLADRLDLFDLWPFYRFTLDNLWPLALIGLGLVLFLRGLSRKDSDPSGGGSGPGATPSPPEV